MSDERGEEAADGVPVARVQPAVGDAAEQEHPDPKAKNPSASDVA